MKKAGNETLLKYQLVEEAKLVACLVISRGDLLVANPEKRQWVNLLTLPRTPRRNHKSWFSIFPGHSGQPTQPPFFSFSACFTSIWRQFVLL
jgi:hypothetical protein